MLFDYIFLLKNNGLFFTGSTGEGKHNFAIPLDKDALNHKAKFFEQFYHAPYPFCFVIAKEIIKDNDKTTAESLLGFLTTSLFLPNYLKHKMSSLILLDDDFETTYNLGLYKEALATELGKQGIKEIVIESLNERDFSGEYFNSQKLCISNNELNDYLAKGDQDTNSELPIKSLVTPELFQKKWIIALDDENDYNKKVKRLEYFENMFSAGMPLTASLIKMINEEQRTSSVLLVENEILKFKLQNHADYLKLIKGDAAWYIQEHNNRIKGEPGFSMQNEGNNSAIQASYKQLHNQIEYIEANRKSIMDWYTKEYEVLPKWYKRFGHIIKAFMGKRSFKSLVK